MWFIVKWIWRFDFLVDFESLPPANVVCEGYVFTPVCLSTGVIPACISGGIPACLAAGLQGVVSQHALQVSRPTPVRGKLRGLAGGGLQAHTQGGSWGVWPGGIQAHTQGVSRPTSRGSPGPHPGGSPGPHQGGVSRPTLKLVSRPTPRGSPDPHLGALQAHTQRVCIPACTEADPLPNGYCCGQYASYWNVFLSIYAFFREETWTNGWKKIVASLPCELVAILLQPPVSNSNSPVSIPVTQAN